MNNILLSPAIAFPVLLAASGLFYLALRGLTMKKEKYPVGLAKPYACGEEQFETAQADYAQFFPFAFFFTILHVVALTVTTVPVETMGNYLIAVLYVLGAVVGLTILYRS